MMEAVSGSDSAAGIYLKVAVWIRTGEIGEERERARESHVMKGKIRLQRAEPVPCLRANMGLGEQGGEGGGRRDN